MTILWNQIRSSLKEDLENHQFNTWILPIRCVESEERRLVLKVPNKFVRDWIRDHYSALILEKLKILSQSQEDWSLNFVIDKYTIEVQSVEKSSVSSQTQEVSATTPSSPTPQISHGFNQMYTFDHFVIGDSNQFAHAACRAVANAPAELYNPLFIYGGVGLGKTHLLHAMGSSILRKNPKARIHYTSSEKFMNELIYGIRFDKMNHFRQKYRHQCDVLLMDDIQFIAGKERTQEEFFHTFNSLYEAHAQIVLTSDQFPKNIPDLEDRLRSRFEWGLIADIQPPDLETRIAIVKKKAEQEKIVLPNDVALFLASHIKSNVRELEGAFIRVSAFASLAGTPITHKLAQDVLHNLLKRDLPNITTEFVQKTVADYYNIHLSDLIGAQRFKSFALPRQIAMYLCRKHIKASYPELGHKFGGKDHSTVVHAVSKIEKLSSSSPELKKELSTLETLLNI